MKQILMLDLDRKSTGARGKTKHEKARIGNPAQIQSHQRSIHPVETIGDISNMHMWTINDGDKILANNIDRRTGIRFRYDKDVHLEVKRACSQFAIWLRTQYYFPLRVAVYVKGTKRCFQEDN